MWPGWIGTGGRHGLGLRVPHVQVPENPFDDIGLVDECDGAHRSAAVGTFQRVDLVDFLNQPGPAGLASAGGWSIMVDSGESSPLSARFWAPRERLE